MEWYNFPSIYTGNGALANGNGARPPRSPGKTPDLHGGSTPCARNGGTRRDPTRSEAAAECRFHNVAFSHRRRAVVTAAGNLRFCEAIWMVAGFCEGRERRSVPNVHDRANDEQGPADAEWQSKKMAERVGFEPTVKLPPHSISNAAPSSTRPSLRSPYTVHPLSGNATPRSEKYAVFRANVALGMSRRLLAFGSRLALIERTSASAERRLRYAEPVASLSRLGANIALGIAPMLRCCIGKTPSARHSGWTFFVCRAMV